VYSVSTGDSDTVRTFVSLGSLTEISSFSTWISPSRRKGRTLEQSPTDSTESSAIEGTTVGRPSNRNQCYPRPVQVSRRARRKKRRLPITLAHISAISIVFGRAFNVVASEGAFDGLKPRKPRLCGPLSLGQEERIRAEAADVPQDRPERWSAAD
jgi:hypothetical protein